MARMTALALVLLFPFPAQVWAYGPEGGPDSIRTETGYVDRHNALRGQRHLSRAIERGTRRAEREATFTSGRIAIEEARRYLGMTARQIGLSRFTLWCGTFLGEATSLPHPRHYQLAASWAAIGRRIDFPLPGAIALVRRGRRIGHVGLVTGTDANGNPVIISGNHRNRVAEVAYPRRAVAAYILP